MVETLEIDGSMGEGGGQVLRTAVALSAILRRPIRVFNIRARRSNPGLRPQHFAAVNAVARLTGARVEGLQVGSREIVFTPGGAEVTEATLDVGTAGSVPLVLQALMPVLAFSSRGASLVLKGGTNNPRAPPIDYVKEVFARVLAEMGYHVDIVVEKRGFYPRGGGIVRFRSKPVEVLKPFNLTGFPGLRSVRILVYSARLPRHVADRTARSASLEIFRRLGVEPSVEVEFMTGGESNAPLDPGCGIMILGTLENNVVFASSSLGERGKPSERVGLEAASEFIKQVETGAPVDRNLADQLVVYAALAKGVSKLRTSEITLHTLTTIRLVELFLPVRFQVEGDAGAPGGYAVEGVGFKRPAA
ncbi:MAG: RNA 3'-terminal phosphate cyclase [Candidatus Brockarchaeota archaeon]|nr:RNA 3'-terminal phosphate cyclase [Candidatus Brockarchaeota archaeon]MBO3809328.1 RNA 3'-terminal phosphate cyclase [Candidatus Brockarchaeota archaeon]